MPSHYETTPTNSRRDVGHQARFPRRLKPPVPSGRTDGSEPAQSGRLYAWPPRISPIAPHGRSQSRMTGRPSDDPRRRATGIAEIPVSQRGIGGPLPAPDPLRRPDSLDGRGQLPVGCPATPLALPRCDGQRFRSPPALVVAPAALNQGFASRTFGFRHANRYRRQWGRQGTRRGLARTRRCPSPARSVLRTSGRLGRPVNRKPSSHPAFQSPAPRLPRALRSA